MFVKSSLVAMKVRNCCNNIECQHWLLVFWSQKVVSFDLVLVLVICSCMFRQVSLPCLTEIQSSPIEVQYAWSDSAILYNNSKWCLPSFVSPSSYTVLHSLVLLNCLHNYMYYNINRWLYIGEWKHSLQQLHSKKGVCIFSRVGLFKVYIRFIRLSCTLDLVEGNQIVLQAETLLGH